MRQQLVREPGRQQPVRPGQRWQVDDWAIQLIALIARFSQTTTADGSGNFSFNNVTNGIYIVTPSKTGSTFTPASQSVTVNSANLTGVNFTGN